MSLDLQDDNNAWSPIARHGDSPAKVRAALELLQINALNVARRKMKEFGATESEINNAAARLERRMSDSVDRDLPRILADMARTAS